MKEASQLNVSLRGADRSWTRLSKTVLTFVLAPRAKAQEQCKVGPIIAFEQRKYNSTLVFSEFARFGLLWVGPTPTESII